jgi:hypothetical protein
MADLKQLREEAEWQKTLGGGRVSVEAGQLIELIDAAEPKIVLPMEIPARLEADPQELSVEPEPAA